MNRVSFQIGITLDGDALEVLTEIMKQAIDRSTSRLMSAMEEQERREARSEQSRTAIYGGKKPPENVGLLINSNALSKLLNLSQGTIYGMEKEGRMPSAIRIGKAVRWGVEEIKAWIDAGCPDRANWQWPRNENQP